MLYFDNNCMKVRRFRVVPRSDLLPAADRLAGKIIGHDPVAVGYAKQAINRGLDLTLEQGLELEARLGRLLLK